MSSGQDGANVLFHVPFENNSIGLGREFSFEDIYRSKGNVTGTPFEYEVGIAGKGAAFSWKNGYPGICFPNHNNLNPDSGTVSLWIKWTEPIFLNQYYRNIQVCFGNENEVSQVALVPLNDKRLALIAEDGKWHHFVYTWDVALGTRKQFLDGKPLASGEIKSPVNPKVLVFGYRLPGSMDEIVVLDRALSDDEVTKSFSTYRAGQLPFAKLDSPEKKFLPFEVGPKISSSPASGVEWDLAEVLTSTETRATYRLGGYWRFQPTKSPRAETHPDKWFYVRSPAMWRPGAELFDKNLKKTDFWKPSVDDLSAGGGRDLTLGSYPCAWFERDFEVPPGSKNRQYLLRFPMGATFEAGGWHSVARASDVFVNGRFAGTVFNSGKSLDVTQLVNEEGNNRLSILNGRPWLSNVTMAGFSQDPELEIRARRDVTVGELLVFGRVRKKELAVRTEMKNTSGEPVPIEARARILDARTGELAATLEAAPFVLEKDAEGEHEIVFPGADQLKTWSPETPQLYHLELVLRQDGETFDSAWPVRFGYREVWVENGEIYLNGDRLSIRGKSHNYLGDYGFSKLKIDMLKKVGQNADRTLTPSPENDPSLDITDEEGWLVFYHVRNLTKIPDILSRVGNHPSVIAWQIFGNGFVNGPHGHPMQIGGEISDETRKTEYAYKRADYVRKNDPTGRLVFFYRLGVGGDFRGIMTTLGWGTPVQTIEEWPLPLGEAQTGSIGSHRNADHPASKP